MEVHPEMEMPQEMVLGAAVAAVAVVRAVQDPVLDLEQAQMAELEWHLHLGHTHSMWLAVGRVGGMLGPEELGHMVAVMVEPVVLQDKERSAEVEAAVVSMSHTTQALQEAVELYSSQCQPRITTPPIRLLI
jgi:hypothetical protein